MKFNKRETQLLKLVKSIAEEDGKLMTAVKIGNNRQIWQYLVYPSKEFGMYRNSGVLPEHRRIRPHEIVIETDAKNGYNYLFYQTIKDKIKDQFTFGIWFSGNKSYHIQLLFKELMTYSDDNRKLLKELFTQWLFDCDKNHTCTKCDGNYKTNWRYLRTVDGKRIVQRVEGKKCLIPLMKVDMQLTGKHMIRLEHAKHEKTNKKKRLMYETKHEIENRLPKEVLLKFKAIKDKQRVWRPMQDTKIVTNWNCLKFFATESFVALKDGRDRALLSLVAFWKRQGNSRTAAYDLAKSYNKNTLLNYFTDIKIRAKINYVYDSLEKTIGCRWNKAILRELGRIDVCLGCKK